MSNFKTWFEDQGTSLNAGFPELQNRGSNTPASDEVKRTNLQPQVDAQTPEAKGHKEKDKLLAIDSELERVDVNLPSGKQGSKVNQFRQIWNKMKAKWDNVKMSDDEAPEQDQEGQGLGTAMGDPKYLQQMQSHPNMVPSPGSQGPHGPGIFGQV